MNTDFNNMELNTTTKIDSLDVLVKTYYQGTDKLGYEVILNNALLFNGTDYRPSPLYGVDSLDAVLDLLGFISVGEFTKYTPEQLEFRNSYIRERLSLLVSDCQDKDSEYYESAINQIQHEVN